MPALAITLLLALLLGKAGFDEMLVLGIRQQLVQPFWAGVAGMAVAALIAVAGMALWRRWRAAPRLAYAAGAASVLFHVYGALPPHRNVGIIGAVLGIAAAGILLFGVRRYRPVSPVTTQRA
jgi:hypothetical protein